MALDAQSVGRRIQDARVAKGWTQIEFAAAANVSPSSVQRWESGKLPPVRELLRVAELLEVEAETLVEPPAEGRPQDALLREVAAGVRELERVSELLDRKLDDVLGRLGSREGEQSIAEAARPQSRKGTPRGTRT